MSRPKDVLGRQEQRPEYEGQPGRVICGCISIEFAERKGARERGWGRPEVPTEPGAGISDLPGPKAPPPGKSVLLTGLSEKMVDIWRPHLLFSL